jgi:hypothetical protein
MGLRSRLKRILREFSGEFSSAAPEQTTPYSRPGVPDEDAEVVMARLTRANSLTPGPKKKKDDDE